MQHPASCLRYLRVATLKRFAEGFYQSSEQSNLLMPARVDERVIRVYSRRREPEVIREISKGFRKLLREHMCVGGGVGAKSGHCLVSTLA